MHKILSWDIFYLLLQIIILIKIYLFPERLGQIKNYLESLGEPVEYTRYQAYSGTRLWVRQKHIIYYRFKYCFALTCAVSIVSVVCKDIAHYKTSCPGKIEYESISPTYKEQVPKSSFNTNFRSFFSCTSVRFEMLCIRNTLFTCIKGKNSKALISEVRICWYIK